MQENCAFIFKKMNITIYPGKLNGTIDAITSKAFAHRAIICACLAEGESRIKNVNFCDDVKSTINALREIVTIKRIGNDLIIKGGISGFDKERFTIRESGSTLRFLLPLLSYFDKTDVEFLLGDALAKRPLDDYEKIYTDANQKFLRVGNSVKVGKFPDENVYKISSGKSSQFVTGILFLAPILGHDTTINIAGEITSKPYIDLTISVLKAFGINVKLEGNNIFVIGNQKFKKNNVVVPSDSSSAVTFALMNKLGSNVVLSNLKLDKNEPDYSTYENISKATSLVFPEIDYGAHPDLVPVVAGYLSYASKTTSTLSNVERLRYKESDRIESTIKTLSSLGGEAIYDRGSLVVMAKPATSGGVLDTYNDHRVVMMAALLSTVSEKPITIVGAECVYKSYPGFFDDLKKLGARIVVSAPSEYSFYMNGKATTIYVGRGSAANASKYYPKNKKYCLISDDNVPENLINNFVSSIAGRKIDVYRLESHGEKTKSLENVQKTIDHLLSLDFSRSDELIAFGGGTISDLVGFVAMIYKRGVEFTTIPTTLLCQADASIGGKTAIDEAGVKNSIGGFYNPRCVIVDTGFADELPEEEKKSGMAEIIKIASLSDPDLFYDIYDSTPYEHLDRWIECAIIDKLKFVKIDPNDNRERKALNFGHTYGHAIEEITQLSHGYAVAQGMMIESENKPLKQCLIKYGFKEYDSHKKAALYVLIKNDKKIYNGKITVVDLKEIGCFDLKEETVL